MIDATLRARERAARAEDSPEVRARVLVDRMRAAPPCETCGGSGRGTDGWPQPVRDWQVSGPCGSCAGTGSPFRARVELAAHCGDEACLRAVGSVLWAKQARFPEWVRGLARWGPDVQVRAAIAGVDACGPFSWPVGARERLLEWVSGSRDTRETLALMDWAAGNGMNVGADLQPWHWSFLQAESSQQSPYAMSRAVGSAGEPTIRSAIQSALILYALGEP